MSVLTWSSNLQQAVRSVKRMEVRQMESLLHDSQLVELTLEEKKALDLSFRQASGNKDTRNSYWA